MKEADNLFKEIYKRAENDKGILGLFFEGSRGKGRVNKYSDYDIRLIVSNGMSKKYEKMFDKFEAKGDMDIGTLDINQLRVYAEFGSPEEWERYSFAHVKVLIDKTGKLQRIIDEKSKIPRKILKKYVSGNMDGYINGVYRSVKCFRNKNYSGVLLEATYSIPLLLNVLFAIDGRRIKPYFDYLEWELEKFPLEKFSINSKELLKLILDILKDGNLKSQQRLFTATEKLLRQNNYAKVLDSWKVENINLIKNFKG